MKGPGHKAKFRIERIWECPACQRRQRTSGKVVNLACHCLGQQKWMRLIEENPKPRPPAGTEERLG